MQMSLFLLSLVGKAGIPLQYEPVTPGFGELRSFVRFLILAVPSATVFLLTDFFF